MIFNRPRCIKKGRTLELRHHDGPIWGVYRDGALSHEIDIKDYAENIDAALACQERRAETAIPAPYTKAMRPRPRR
jgi:hypothetical protein